MLNQESLSLGHNKIGEKGKERQTLSFFIKLKQQVLSHLRPFAHAVSTAWNTFHLQLLSLRV
jgi:hypothetical protein